MASRAVPSGSNGRRPPISPAFLHAIHRIPSSFFIAGIFPHGVGLVGSCKLAKRITLDSTSGLFPFDFPPFPEVRRKGSRSFVFFLPIVQRCSFF